jgi:hypothetical protein
MSSRRFREVLQQHWYALDDYGSTKELEIVERYWPGHSKQWFEAFRGLTRALVVRVTRASGDRLGGTGRGPPWPADS